MQLLCLNCFSFIFLTLYQLELLLSVFAENCDVQPTVTLDDYVDAIETQTISARPGWFESLYDTEDMPPKRNLYLYRNGARCHYQHGRRHRNTIDNLSVCPFKWVVNEDEERIPRRLWHALCLCNSPREEIGDSNTYVCNSIVQFVSVFRKYGCTYRKVFEPLPVACVAVNTPHANLASGSRIVTEP